MTKRMLIDAAHPEETRVVVIDGNRLEEFDFESSTKKQLKGNIYLAKVVRVEPSLQAAFVDYGGNRHGFLAFNEIHPDYYQIPIADRQALIEQEAHEQRERAREPDDAVDGAPDDATTADDGDVATADDGDAAEPTEADDRADEDDGDDDDEAEASAAIEEVSGDEIDEIKRRPRHPSRRYKIQEVIKRRQILLVQVGKEERGNKGAALTSYLSLAGRYCVLMPNTARGGGISRKIVNPDDRKRLKEIATNLPVAEGMGVILRTAGMDRRKTEIEHDFNYLSQLWDGIREQTLNSIAPALIHEEANLIKRAIRDLHSKEIEEILVEGDEGYRMAKSLMRTLVPSHARRVKAYNEPIALFQRYQVESQIDAMHSPVVQLKSGGYIVINPTEALVAIDVNSGKATRERNIEETAYKTNLEAAEEVARQLRLRDLAGLIVIDFIDMDDSRNNRTVERRFKEAIKSDRARTQMGRISPFGLMELSRQRLRPSLLETSTLICQHCGGSGRVRSIESTALHVLRAIEEEGIRERSSAVTVAVPTPIALYVLNRKREVLRAIEERYGFEVTFSSDDSLIVPAFRLERIRARGGEAAEAETGDDVRKERGRRPSRPRRADPEKAPPAEATEATEEAAADAEDQAAVSDAEGGEAEPRKRRRRGRRGGRRRRGAAQTETDSAVAEASEAATTDGVDASTAPAEETEETVLAEPATTEADAEAVTAEPEKKPRSRRKPKADGEKPPRARRSRSKKAETAEVVATIVDDDVSAVAEPPPPAPEPLAPVAEDPAPPLAARPSDEAPAVGEPKQSGRRGWWQRLTS